MATSQLSLYFDIMHILGYDPATVIRKECILVQYSCGFQVTVHFTSSVAEKFQIHTTKTEVLL